MEERRAGDGDGDGEGAEVHQNQANQLERQMENIEKSEAREIFQWREPLAQRCTGLHGRLR